MGVDDDIKQVLDICRGSYPDALRMVLVANAFYEKEIERLKKGGVGGLWTEDQTTDEDGLMSSAFNIVRAHTDRAIELLSDHKRQRRFLTSIYLPSVIQDMHARIWRGRDHQSWRAHRLEPRVILNASGTTAQHSDGMPAVFLDSLSQFTRTAHHFFRR